MVVMRSSMNTALLVTVALCICSDAVSGQDLPTVYEYFTEGGIKSGLEAVGDDFKLNGKTIRIYSGAMHYFRVHPQHWRDRLQKLRATGLIAVETYVPWNLHEPEKGFFDFGNGGRDFSPFLDLVSYIKIAQEEDLLVILRSGPYICAEWEMGGLPSWLHSIPGIIMRSSEKQYTERVTAYFNQLLPLVRDLQFTNNGSIIAVQLENEFSSSGYTEPDDQYLYNLKNLMESNEIRELYFTSDNTLLAQGSIPEVMRTINFQNYPELNFDRLLHVQPDKPLMVMEFWTGWFDHWMNPVMRHRFPPESYRQTLETIMKFPASFNLYMFHGGTSFGFMNGANHEVITLFDVTSYDYDAPLSESGDYTEKYNITEELVTANQPIQFKKPLRPTPSKKIAYSTAVVEDYLNLSDIYEAAGPPLISKTVLSMEDLNINNGSGQSYGYTWYRKEGLNASVGNILKISGRVRDIAQVYLDGKLLTKVLVTGADTNGFGYWKVSNAELVLADSGSTLDILVENMGRINFGKRAYSEKKGLSEGPVSLDGIEISDWKILPLELKGNWIRGLENRTWKAFDLMPGSIAPGLYRIFLTLSQDEDPEDTFLDTSGWTKGVVFINGFNLGRFNKLGPQQRLYLPGPLLKKGENTIILFEQFIPFGSISFSDNPNLG